MATTTLEPYLYFEGRCEEAIEFYRKTLGAQVGMMLRFKDNPSPGKDGCAGHANENKIMHANLTIGGHHLLVSDGRCSGQCNFNGFSLALTAETPAEVDRLFNALADGGKVIMALEKTFFSPRFGMVTDRFGVIWIVLAR